MITFTRTPEFYAPLGGKALYTFESDTPGTFDVRIADAASDKMLGAMRFTEVAEATFDAAPVLRRALRYTPATGGTGISQATGRQVMADVKIYEGPEGTEAVAEAGLCLLLGTDRAVQAPALLSSMPRQRLIAPGECDELTLFCSRSGAVIVTAQRGRDYTAESYRIPSPGLFLFRLDTRDFPGAETLTVDTGECGTVVYSLVAAPQGAVRLAWRSEAGSFEHYTFPIVATERMKSSKRRATDAEGQAVVLSGSAEVRRRLVSAYECEEVARALAGIVASPDVRIARGDEYIPVEVLTEELDVRDEGELRSLEIEIRKKFDDMELRIDSKACDLGEGKLAIPAYDAATLADVQACRTGRTLRLELPATPRNDAVMEFAREALSAGRFDAAEHRAVLSYGGAELFAGSVRLLATTDAGYRIEIRDGGAQWAETAARRMFSALEIDYDAQLTSETVSESWTGDTPVRFFPVHRDEYPQRNNSEDLLPGERLLSTDDYLPFLHVATLAERIFEQTGYRVRSRFFGSEFFRSLYLSGAYASRDTTVLAARMGFCARRLSEASATADHLGRVYADPNAIYSTVGNIVETAAAGVADADGEKVEETFDNGGCFVTEEGKIRFVPTTEVTAGFEYYLRYTTDHRIESRTRLRGFDTLWLTPGTPMAFALANRYEDRRAAIEPGFRYRIVVFDHAEGDSYRLTCTHDAVTGTVWGSFAARSALVTTPAAGSLSDPALLVLRGGVWEPYAGDWALYDGYVGETGRTTVEVRVCTEAERVAPASPKRFDRIFFSGADEGMTLTLHKECSLRPCFRTGPGFGAWMTFADVARHRMRQIELIEALAHLFNLRFYTERGTRTVWIEPADDFFGAGPEVDWSDRTDFSQEVVRTRIAPEVHERRTWRYLPAEGAVARFETETGTTFGAWSYDTDSRAALQGEQVRTSPLFAATLDSVGHYAGAPSARMLQIGDRDAAEQDPTSFTPRIVRYAGMRPLPDGERWGYPGGNTYPLAAFHFEGDAATEGFTLGFGDCDGIEGLHRFYDRQLARETLRERIRLALRIAPDEYAALFAPGCGTAELRSVFRIDTGTGVVRALLRGVDDYDPEAGVVRCTFERLVED